MKKTLYTLMVNGYSPRITKLTLPMIRFYAHKIGADFHIITERKFLEWPITYEKMQVHELSRNVASNSQVVPSGSSKPTHSCVSGWGVVGMAVKSRLRA